MPCKHARPKGKSHQPSISLHPLTPEDALAGLMQVKPPGKEVVDDEEGKGKAEPETKEPS